MVLFSNPAQRRAPIALCVLALLAGLSFAQNNNGELRIAVKDASGSAVEANADLLNQASKTTISIHVSENGHYVFKNLPFGTYLLTISYPGFSPFSELVKIDSVVPETRHVVLNIQPTQVSVQVNAAQTLLNIDRPAATYYTNSREINERRMGIPGRGLIDLAAMQPGWTLEANGILHPRESEYETQFVVDGFPVQDNRSPAFARPIEADNVESVKQYTSGIPAEFGDKLGGVIELNTTRNTSPGFHGVYIAQGGSFATLSNFLSGQYVAGKTTIAASGEAFTTDRYLDPPTQDNFMNHASSTAFTATGEHDFNDADRLRVSLLNQQTWLQVPNDLLQQAAGQRQDRTSSSTEGQLSYQHLFSPALLGSIRLSGRDVAAGLWSNPLSTPISVSQQRDYHEVYWDASLAGNTGANDWKAGTQGRYASEAEKFAYNIVAYQIDGEQIFDDNLPKNYSFNGHAVDREQAVYAQDTIHFSNLNVNLGLRFDHYNFLVDETAWSPRLGIAYMFKPLQIVLHASYDRTFGTPPFENLLVSSSVLAPGSRFRDGLYLPVRPSRGNYYEVGLSKALGRNVRLDASWFLRDVRNFEDDDLLLNTGVSFPVTFYKGVVKGTEVKLEIPHWGRFSGFLGYSNTTGLGQYPISGGLFLDAGDIDLLNAHYKFPISQDIRNAASAYLRYQITDRLWTAWTASYTSGLPVEDAQDLPDRAFLIAQFGEDVVNSVNFDRGRVHPSFSLNASLGFDLFRKERYKATVQADVTNITDRLNVINFAGLLSGTAVGVPRSGGARLRLDF